MKSDVSPLLSVCLLTYNHVDYIQQSIESILMQKVDFPIEIVIADDCSTDGTQEIVKDYAAKYEFIRPILQEKNVGMARNVMDLLSTPSGKYVACIEGDDYWTDSYKLQKQVDFLEVNSDFAISFHRVNVVYEADNDKNHITNTNDTVKTFEDLAAGNFIHTVSCVFRRQFKSLPDWFANLSVTDYPVHLLNAQHGKIGFINEVMAVYRIHKGGMWGAKNPAELYAKWIPIIKECRKQFYPRGEKQFTEQLAKSHQQLCFAYFEANRYKDFRQNFSACIPLVRHIKGRAFFALTVRYLLSYTPGIADLYKKTLTSSKPMIDSSN